METRFTALQTMHVFGCIKGALLHRTGNTISRGSIVTIRGVEIKTYDHTERLAIPLATSEEPLYILVEDVSPETLFLHSQWVCQFEASTSEKTDEAKEAARQKERELREKILAAVRVHTKAHLTVVPCSS